MAKTKTAYRWNANGWYFKSIEVSEDPDFEGEYNLPRQSTWDVPMEDTETQWAKINTPTLKWELADLSMQDRLLMNLITQEEYDTWFAKKDGQFLSVLKTRADSDAANIALVSDVEKEAESRSKADILINENIESALASIKSLSDSLAENTSADSQTKSSLEQAITALQSTTQALQVAVNNKADVGHTHDVVNAANKLTWAKQIGNAWFDGTGNITLEQMGVNALVTAAMANAGSITVEKRSDGFIVRDTKNKVGFMFSFYTGDSTVYGPFVPGDFKDIVTVLGSADSGSTRITVDKDGNDICLYSTDFFNNASVFVAATLR